MKWETLLTTARYAHPVNPSQELGRRFFHKDHDRIVFSPSFRRLAGKTQVHPMGLNDEVHTRLIHSVEVGSVGRSIGLQVGERLADDLPECIRPDDLGLIVQAACLAHDIGNPPFGHAGEYAIQDWFMQHVDTPLLAPLTDVERLDLTSFEGNAQGFRLVSQIEYHLFQGGLRLSYPTMGALLKYPWTVDHKSTNGKFSCYQSELPQLQELAESLGLVEQEKGKWCRHPFSYLMEAADDICYGIIDLEDAVMLNILRYDEVWEILSSMCRQHQLNLELTQGEVSAQRQLAALRGTTIQALIDAVVDAFMEQLPTIMAGELEGDLFDYCPEEIQSGLKRAKTLARQRIFKDSNKTEVEIGAYATLSSLLSGFCTAGKELHDKKGENLSYRTTRVFDLMGAEAPKGDWTLYQIYRRILDFISGVTDDYANYLAQKMSGGLRLSR